MDSSYFCKKLIKTTPKEISEATKAATAKAVLALSVSTTVRTPAGMAVAGLAVMEAAGFDPPAGLAMVPAVEPAGLAAAGNAAVAPTPGGFAPATAGRGGREILMVSLRRSDGGLAMPGTTGKADPPPETDGAAGFGMAGAVGRAGTGGLEGGASRMVSFLIPPGGEDGTAAGAPGLEIGAGTGGGFREPAPGGMGGLGIEGTAGAPGGRGGGGGKGTPSAI